MIEVAVRHPWVQDLPVCLPGRGCVDQSPVAAPLVDVTSALTPFSALIAVLCFTAAGVALVLVGPGLQRQWRGRGAPVLLMAVAAGLVLLGAFTWWAVSARLALVSALYSGRYGQPSAPVPASLVGSWPAVVAAGLAMAGAGGLVLTAVLGGALLRPRRDPASNR